MKESARDLGIYIHVPFCRVHCPYCDFYTYPAARGRDGDYLTALRREIALIRRRLNPDDYEVATVYFGGGTPSTMATEGLKSVLEALQETFRFKSEPEISLEANPEDLSPSFLRALSDLGIHRISLGVQSFQPERLQWLGRVHDTAQASAALELLAGRTHWSADLMFGWNGQSVADLKAELNRLWRFSPPHVSLYQLTFEPQTRFGVLAAQGQLLLADPDLQADLYLCACEMLSQWGLVQYEVSNFAKPGAECRHNQAYWARKPYVGFGPAAASLIGDERTRNVRSLPEYVRRLDHGETPVDFTEELSAETVLRERVWLGLRTRAGIPLSWLHDNAANVISRAHLEGLLTTVVPGRIALSTKGMAVADALVRRLLLTDST